MSSESIISLFLGFPLALYGSVVFSRFSRFAELRNEVLRIIRTIDFMQEQSGVSITNVQDVPKLTLIASDLLSLKHREAAEVVSAIRSGIDEISMHAKIGRLNVSAFGQSYSNWQSMARELPPNKLALWNPWSKL
jgi:hypothetical protein